MFGVLSHYHCFTLPCTDDLINTKYLHPFYPNARESGCGIQPLAIFPAVTNRSLSPLPFLKKKGYANHTKICPSARCPFFIRLPLSP